MKFETLSVKTITLDTKEMYDHYVGISKDLLWNTASYKIDSYLVDYLVKGNMEKIRAQFMEGNTPLLMNMDLLEANADVEIRITHNERLIGVVLNNEIYY